MLAPPQCGAFFRVLRMIWTGALPYFSERELACRGTGVIRLDLRFAAALPALRAAWGRPLDLTESGSVCRTPEHNLRVRGHPRSMHLTDNPVHPTHGTMAADIPWRGWAAADQLRFARLAYRMGWSVGLHDGFCHVDRRADLGLPNLPKAVFLYGDWSGNFGPDEVM